MTLHIGDYLVTITESGAHPAWAFWLAVATLVVFEAGMYICEKHNWLPYHWFCKFVRNGE